MTKVSLIFIQIISFILLSCFLDIDLFIKKDYFKVVFLDVGQGDAILIRSPNNCTMLVDGGPPQKLVQSIKKHLPVNERVIDLVVVTHPHLDHIAGILELEHRYDFKNLWLTGVSYKLNEYDQLMLQASKNSDTKIEYINQKSEYDLCGIKITVLHSGESSIGEEMENINNSSIIILLEINGKKILLTGDAEIEQEEEFLLEYRDSLESSGDVDILKAGHHGSRTSTSRELIEAVNPEYLVISSGRDNTYGHPHLETIKKADQFGIKILRTDQRGDVIFFFE